VWSAEKRAEGLEYLHPKPDFAFRTYCPLGQYPGGRFELIMNAWRAIQFGMTVMSARYWSPKARLTTRAGRVFPAMPKSISQISPQRGVAILFLKGLEQDGGGSADFLVCQGSGIERQGTAQQLVRKGALLFHGELFEGVQQCFGISAHEDIIPAHRRAKKKSLPQPNGR